MIRIELTTCISDIPLSKELWNKLASENITNTVFQTYEWFNSWWTSYGDNHELFFLTAYLDEVVVGIAPLIVSNKGFGRRILHFAGDRNADYCDFIINSNRYIIISSFLEYILSRNFTWSILQLTNIPDTSTSITCLQDYCNKFNSHYIITPHILTPTLIIQDRTDEAYSIINKYSIMRHVRKLEKIGSLNVEHYTDRAAIDKYLDNFFEQHISRNILKHRNSQFLNDGNKLFYKRLVEFFDSTNWLILSVLFLNGKPISYHFGFEYNQRLIWYKPSFDANYHHYSPGTVLLRSVVDYSIKKSLNELDFTIGNESYKERFCNHARKNNSFIIHKSCISYFISTLSIFIISLLKRRI